MNNQSKKTAYLLLSDGTLFEGLSFGYEQTVIGEVVFNTGITGYQEVLTDPSYFGQIIAFTYPEIGNTGINVDDNESSFPSVKGLITRQITLNPSNWRSESSLNDWLIKNNVVGISGIDTRALVRHLRSVGTINGAICSNAEYSPEELLKKLKAHPSMKGLNLVSKVSTKEAFTWKDLSPVEFDQRKQIKTIKPYRVAAIDFGIKRSILQRFTAYGCEVEVLPSDSSLDSVLDYKPEGVFLSNGPGDPSAVLEGISLTKELLKQANLPIFGICLGHQILGLALGARAFKLPYGHRGLNHPCGKNGQIEITSQNHGFALDPSSLNQENIEVTHFNLNDKTVAGISLKNRPVFGIQYHPEAGPGPHDADHHFSNFVSLMEERR